MKIQKVTPTGRLSRNPLAENTGHLGGGSGYHNGKNAKDGLRFAAIDCNEYRVTLSREEITKLYEWITKDGRSEWQKQFYERNEAQ